MKLITAIINKKDESFLSNALTERGFYHTRISTNGGFLRKTNATILIGIENNRLEEALEIIRSNCKKRVEQIPSFLSTSGIIHSLNYNTAEVVVGGATIFVTNIEYFDKI